MNKLNHIIADSKKLESERVLVNGGARGGFFLPKPIAAYYHASDVYDDDLLASCFAEDAILIDEGEEYHGPKDVSGHILEANRNAKVITEITDCIEKNDETVVTATISGNFDGSPVPLDFHFTLNNGKIKTLNIVMADEIVGGERLI